MKGHVRRSLVGELSGCNSHGERGERWRGSHCFSAESMFNVPAANLPTWHNLHEVTVEALSDHLPLRNPTNGSL